MESPKEVTIDSECLERFLKFETEQMTEEDGEVAGTLLLTPTCLMFDPELSAPLVVSKGQDRYGLVCNLIEIVSVSVYQDCGCLDDEKKEIFDPERFKEHTVPEEMETNDETESFDMTESLNTSVSLNRSLDALNELWIKTKQARKDAKSISWAALPPSPDGLVPAIVADKEGSLSQYFLCVRLRGNKTASGASPNVSSMSIEENLPFGNKDRREFWFSIPTDMATKIYYFLLQWLPDKYGMDITVSTSEETDSSMLLDPMSPEQSFVFLDSTSEENLYAEATNCSSNLEKEWEFVTISELWRRIRPDRLIDIAPTLPYGAETSKILDHSMIMQILNILPARAQGYSWVKCYDSSRDGLLLSTFYRNIKNEFHKEMSPLLLILRDSKGSIFGAVTAEPFVPWWKFQGTGASFLWRFSKDEDSCPILEQYTWTGKNDYFLLAAKDYFCMGAGQGRHGLYLDADLLHGHTERCETYANEILTGNEQDFTVDAVETFGFRL